MKWDTLDFGQLDSEERPWGEESEPTTPVSVDDSDVDDTEILSSAEGGKGDLFVTLTNGRQVLTNDKMGTRAERKYFRVMRAWKAGSDKMFFEKGIKQDDLHFQKFLINEQKEIARQYKDAEDEERDNDVVIVL